MNRRITFRRSEVPYLSRTRIEFEAARLLAEYGEAHGAVVAPPIPIDEIIELHLKLTFEFRDMGALFGVGDVHGALWIKDRIVGVDQSLDPTVHPWRLGRYRFTLAHEAGHWRLHRRYYESDPNQHLLFGGKADQPSYVCRSSEAKRPVEWQADYFAACLLMPRELVRTAWQAWRGHFLPVTLDALTGKTRGHGGANPVPPRLVNALFERFVRPLAVRFEVSAEALRIRLEELGLLLREPAVTGLYA